MCLYEEGYLPTVTCLKYNAKLFQWRNKAYNALVKTSRICGVTPKFVKKTDGLVVNIAMVGTPTATSYVECADGSGVKGLYYRQCLWNNNIYTLVMHEQTIAQQFLQEVDVVIYCVQAHHTRSAYLERLYELKQQLTKPIILAVMNISPNPSLNWDHVRFPLNF